MNQHIATTDAQFVTLGIDQEVFAVPVETVVEILDMRTMFRVPDAPGCFQTLPFGLSLLGHSSLHVFRKNNILNLNSGNLNAPRFCMDVDYVLYSFINISRL